MGIPLESAKSSSDNFDEPRLPNTAGKSRKSKSSLTAKQSQKKSGRLASDSIGYFGGEGGGTETLGAGMSAALITTFYGAVFANLFFLPMADKIKTRITFSSTLQNLQLEAARLIHQKKHPIIVREKLNSFIPPKEWKREEG